MEMTRVEEGLVAIRTIGFGPNQDNSYGLLDIIITMIRQPDSVGEFVTEYPEAYPAPADVITLSQNLLAIDNLISIKAPGAYIANLAEFILGQVGHSF